MTQEALGRVAMRAHMMLLSARGSAAQEIADIHATSDVTVYTAVSRRREIDRFDEEGPDDLYDREREGRPPKIDEQAERETERVLGPPPTEEGYNTTRWTSPRLAQHLKEKLAETYPPPHGAVGIKRLEFSWKRPRRSLPEDSDYDECMRAILKAISQAGCETIVLFEDETDVRAGG